LFQLFVIFGIKNDFTNRKNGRSFRITVNNFHFVFKSKLKPTTVPGEEIDAAAVKVKKQVIKT
jgi:hypothetical protein